MKTTQELPKCPKCGEEPELRCYYLLQPGAVTYFLACNCFNITDQAPLYQGETCTMILHRCKRRMARKWKEYVKESSDGET